MNKGNQTLNQKVGSRLDPQTQNKLLHEVVPAGVYSGFTLTVVDSDTAGVSPGEAVLKDSGLRHTIHLHTDSSVTVDVNETSPYLILFWQFENREDNYVDFTITDNPGTDAVVLGKAEFDNNGNLTGFDVSNSVRDEVDLTNADQLDGLDSSDFLTKSAYDSNDNGKVDNAENADQATNAINAGDADTVDGFDAGQLQSSSGGTVVDTRDVVFQASSNQTDFTISSFDAKLEKEYVVSGGVGPLNPGASNDYERVDPTATVQNSSRSDNGDTYTIRESKVSYDSTDLETTIPVVEGVSDSTVSGDLDLQGTDYAITAVNTNEDEFVVNTDARGDIPDTVISFNSGREQDEIIYIPILTYVEQGHLNGFNADLLDGNHASDLLDKGTYDSNNDGKVDEADQADQADDSDRYGGVAPADGTDGQVYTTDGTNGSFQDPNFTNSVGTNSGDLNSEQVDQIISADTLDTIPLNNTYSTGIAELGRPDPNNTPTLGEFHVASYQRDNGDIIGVNVYAEDGQEDVRLFFFGVIA